MRSPPLKENLLLPPAWLCVVSLLGHNKFHTVQLVWELYSQSLLECVCGLPYLLKPIHPANIDLWNAVGSHSPRELLRQSAPLLQFLLPYVWLNKSTFLLSYSLCSPVYEAKQRYICCLQTRSYIIYFCASMDSRSPLVCGVRSLSLLYIPVPRQAEADFSLVDLLQGRLPLVCCGEKQCGLWRPACAWVCLSASGREKLFSPYPSMKGTWRGFGTGRISSVSTRGHQTTDRGKKLQ